MLRKVLYVVIGLVVLLVAAVLIGPSFIDWNKYKPQITAAVEEQTGRTLAIDGDISLSILPAPTLSAPANGADWGCDHTDLQLVECCRGESLPADGRDLCCGDANRPDGQHLSLLCH